MEKDIEYNLNRVIIWFEEVKLSFLLGKSNPNIEYKHNLEEGISASAILLIMLFLTLKLQLFISLSYHIWLNR